MECPQCHGAVWDNRQKKASGEFKPKAPDFSCKDKTGCGWNSSGFAQAGAPAVPPPAYAPPAPQPSVPQPTPRDTQIVALFWASFDDVLEGIAKRKLVDWAKPETIAALTATQFIQRSKG